MDDKIITLESYYDPTLAHIVRTRLEYNNVPCFIADDNMLWAKPYYNEALGGVKLKVFEKDSDRCREILATNVHLPILDPFETDSTQSTNAVCPYCASTNVRSGIATEFRFHLISLLVSIFFGVPLYFRNAWHCFNCQRNF